MRAAVRVPPEVSLRMGPVGKEERAVISEGVDAGWSFDFSSSVFRTQCLSDCVHFSSSVTSRPSKLGNRGSPQLYTFPSFVRAWKAPRFPTIRVTSEGREKARSRMLDLHEVGFL